MRFIGQVHIIRQLEYLLPHLLRSNEGASLLFRGPSGYGKTHLCKLVCNFLAGREYSYQLGDSFVLFSDVHVHFIDEIHLCKSIEVLYPIMDSKIYVLVFATNFDSLLPDPFQNRCINYTFSSYTDKQLVYIFKRNFEYNIGKAVIEHIIRVSNRNPRVMIETYIRSLKLIVEKLGSTFLNLPDDDIIKKLDEIHGIKNELVPSAIDYLAILKSLGGRAPIDTIVNTLKIDKNTIRHEIEPQLLSRNLIKVSSKGRELCS